MGVLNKIGKIVTALFCIIVFFTAFPAQAICPVCTIAVAGGIGLSRYFGVDDTITGLWVGGLAVSLILWTIDWLNRKKINFRYRRLSITVGYYLIIIAPLFWMNIIGHPLNKIWGIDKLIAGIAFGSISFLAGASLHYHHKKKNDNKVYFPFQKVVFSIGPLIILSAIFYFITR